MVIDLARSAWFGTRLIVTRDSIISQARNLSNLRCGLDRARGSVRRTNGFVQIAISLTDFSERTAQDCNIAVSSTTARSRLLLFRLFSVHNSLNGSLPTASSSLKSIESPEPLREPRLSWLAVHYAFLSPSPSVAVHLPMPKIAFVVAVGLEIYIAFLWLVIGHNTDLLKRVTSEVSFGMAIQRSTRVIARPLVLPDGGFSLALWENSAKITVIMCGALRL